MAKSKTLSNLVFTAIFLSFLMIILIGFQSQKITNEETCGTTKLTYSTASSDVEYTNLATNNLAVLVSTEEATKKVVNYEFCLRYNASNNLKTRIVNENNETINYLYLKQGYGEACAKIINYSDYLGINCLNCNSTNNLTIYQSVATNQETNYLITDFKEIINLETDNNPLSYNIFSYDNCSHVVKQFTRLYIILISVLMLLFFILLGVDSFQEKIYALWGDLENEKEEADE